MIPRVSIITPYRDAASFIGDAIGSALRQTVREWELLLVDDRSSDDSTRIARDFADRDSRIQLLKTSEGNGIGAAAARNVGLAEARGDFVAFLDADDLFLPDALETGLALANSHPSAALVSGAARWWHADGEGADWIDRVRRIRPGLYQSPYLLEQMMLLQRDHIPCTCAVLARREAVLAAGGFDESLSLYEDQTLLARLLARHPVYIGTHLTSLYRQHSRSTSAKAERAGEYHRMRAHPARSAFLDWLGRDLAGFAAPSTMSALRIARAMLAGNWTGLSLAERRRYSLLVVSKGLRGLMRKSRRRAGRLLRKKSRLPPIAQ